MNATELSWHRAFLALCLDLLPAGWKRRQLLGGLKCIGRLECQKFVTAGCFFLRRVVPKQRVDGFGDHLDGSRVLGGKRTTKAHQFPPSHTSSCYMRNEDYHEWQGRRELWWPPAREILRA